MRTSAILWLSLIGSTLLIVPAPAQSKLTTLFATNNSLTSPGSNFMDITVTNKLGIVITSLDVNCENTRQGGVGTAFNVQVYITQIGGTYSGNEQKPAAWFLMGVGGSKSKAANTPTPVDISDIFLPPGKFGLAVHYAIPSGSSGTAFAYTTGTSTNNSYSNTDIQLNLGSSSQGLFNGTVYSPRIWNGTIYYEAGTNAAFGIHGVGCSGGAKTGIPGLSGGFKNPLPKLGANFDVSLTNLGSPGAGLLVVGTSFTNWGALTLPVDLAMFGWPGCSAYVSADFLLPFGHTGTPWILSFQVPNQAGLAGVPFGLQALMRDSTSNTGVTMTNLGAGRIGK